MKPKDAVATAESNIYGNPEGGPGFITRMFGDEAEVEAAQRAAGPNTNDPNVLPGMRMTGDDGTTRVFLGGDVTDETNWQLISRN